MPDHDDPAHSPKRKSPETPDSRRDEPNEPSRNVPRHKDRSLFEQLARRTGPLLAVIVGLVGFVQALNAAEPLPHLDLAGVQLLLVVLAVLAGAIKPLTRTILRWMARLLIAASMSAVAVVFVALLLAGHHRSSSPTAVTSRSAITKVQTGLGVVEQINAFDQWFELAGNGAIYVFDEQGAFQTVYSVSGPARSIVACDGSLFITHGEGKVARINPSDGSVEGEYPYSSQGLGDLACWDSELWVDIPRAGLVVELDPTTLKDLYEDRITSYATSIAGGRINGISGIWILNGLSGSLVGIARIDGKLEMVGPFAVRTGGTQILYAGATMWILDVPDSCLNTFDSNTDAEDEPGVPVVAEARSRMSTSDGTVYVAGGGRVTVVPTADPSDVQAIILGPRSSDLVGASEYGGVVMAAGADGAALVANSGEALNREVGGEPPAGRACRA